MRFTIPWLRRRPEPDEQAQQQARIDAKLRAIERQGAGSVFFAHGLAYLLVVAFSAGSLITLAGDAVRTFLAQAHSGAVDIPSLISFIVSFALVFAMDTAMVIAATNVRMHKQRNQPGALIHALMISGVCVVESATYLYMSYVYDHPATLTVWAILVARAVFAPIVAVYLSLARTLPISARDIITQVEIVTGRGVLMDMTKIAADPNATPERKTALYTASATMIEADAQRFHKLMAAERATRDGASPAAAPAAYTLTPAQMGLAAEKTIQLTPPVHPAAFAQGVTMPHKALSPREQRRQALIEDMLGQRGHPTSPRESVEYDANDADEFDLRDLDDSADDWQTEDARMLRNGHLPEMSQHAAKRDRAQAARVAPRGSELTVREFVMPDLPPSKYEKDDDTDQRRAVFRVLDQALAKHESLTRVEVAKRAGVSENTVRSARPLWDERRSKRGQKKAAPRTEELVAVTPEMLATR